MPEPKSPAQLARDLRRLAGEIEATPNEGEARRLAREIRVVADDLADAWRDTP